MTPIKYVGLKRETTDPVADTGLIWQAGQIHFVPDAAVPKLLRHPDVWAIATDDDLAERGMVAREPQDDPAVEPKKADESEKDEPDESESRSALPQIGTLNKAALAKIAHARYGQELDPAMTAADMRARILALENGSHQRGH